MTSFTKEEFLESKKIKLEKEYRDNYFDLVASNFDKENMSAFLHKIDPLLNKILNAYTGSYNNQILKSKLKQLAIRAIKNYDPTKSSLSTHLYNNLKAIMEYTRFDVSPIYTSSKVSLYYQKIIAAQENLRNILGREPTLEELAEHTGLSMQKITSILNKVPPTVSESTTTVGEEGTETPVTQLATFERESAKTDKFRAALEIVYHESSPQEKFVIEKIYGFNNSKILSPSDIAKKLKLSPGRVSQIKKKIDEKLSEYLSVVHKTI